MLLISPIRSDYTTLHNDDDIHDERRALIRLRPQWRSCRYRQRWRTAAKAQIQAAQAHSQSQRCCALEEAETIEGEWYDEYSPTLASIFDLLDRERNRMHNLNDALERLRAALPPIGDDDGGGGSGDSDSNRLASSNNSFSVATQLQQVDKNRNIALRQPIHSHAHRITAVEYVIALCARDV